LFQGEVLRVAQFYKDNITRIPKLNVRIFYQIKGPDPRSGIRKKLIPDPDCGSRG
jgi:hypothetical protein